MSLFSLLFLITAAFAAQTFSCRPEFDEHGIPHLQTGTEAELYYCFGFLHGTDRAWQMDYFRRVGQGRNAEIYGYEHLKGDLMMRLLDVEGLAEKIWKGFPADYKALMENYSAGVNEGFKTGKDAQEFKDQGFSPEPWIPQHSLMVLLLQSFDQTRKTFYRDYEEEGTKERWGARAAELFNEDGLPWENNILKEGEYPKATGTVKKTVMSREPIELWAKFPEVFGEESGSNNWVVSAKKSKTGKAILANDPHLDLKTPLFWYWLHLKSADGELIGASLPGVPVVASGTNGKVAWGLTNAYINTADAYFVSDVKDSDLVSLTPKVYVKVGPVKLPFAFKSFERLKSGYPILPLETKTDKKMALHWTGFSLQADDIIPMLQMMRVKDVTAMNELLKKVGVPAWNFVFADTKGDVGFRVVGKAYQLRSKTPFGLPTRTVKEMEQEDFLDPEDRPAVLRPARNYIYTANNRHWPADAKFYGGRGYSSSFRGYRIDELLRRDQQDTESFKAIQCDIQATDARFFVPKLQKYVKLMVPHFLATDVASWLPVYRRIMDITMEEWKVNEYALFRLLDHLDDKQIKQLVDFTARAKSEIGERTWGEVHVVNFPHLSKNSSWKFSPEIAGVGDTHTVNPGTAKWNEDRKLYEQSAGASMRMIIEMTEKPKIQLSLPGENRNYTVKSERAPWQAWKTCQYFNVTY